ncbi:hypothetical protein [Hydrogenophaga sp.]|uniref:HNH endonuclease n=1 Tax=Hydrogenophaga sp. TaxID=1904254 RepID=UPI00261C3FF8|nr:hypothetical protein [Hydrogenophaga sp.]MDM7948284.1 hypothetical protein [Hydrogenophaga sp.]
MNELCESPAETGVLKRLTDLIEDGTLSGTNAWTCFSKPLASHQFGEPIVPPVVFSSDEQKSLKAIKKRLVALLVKRGKGACAYCKRPVGRYGFGWHLEHVYAKSRFPSKTFMLSNLTIGCVDCNKWKATSVDKTSVEGQLGIIDPTKENFRYGQFLKYVHIATESLSLVKYMPQHPLGKETWTRLRFSEIERVTLIDSMNAEMASLHDRMNDFLLDRDPSDEGDEVATLLRKLQSSMYRLS